jgi:hypothetical protein
MSIYCKFFHIFFLNILKLDILLCSVSNYFYLFSVFRGVAYEYDQDSQYYEFNCKLKKYRSDLAEENSTFPLLCFCSSFGLLL